MFGVTCNDELCLLADECPCVRVVLDLDGTLVHARILFERTTRLAHVHSKRAVLEHETAKMERISVLILWSGHLE